MKKIFLRVLVSAFALAGASLASEAQIIERERPAEWSQLVPGARFMDRFLPMKGEVLSADTWGADSVRPRFVDNGIEDRIWSYWGGNVLRDDDGKYHLMVCGWLESSPKGHMEWGNSYAFNAVGDKPEGPYKVRNMIGKGHNPEAYRLDDGRYVLYVIKARYVADDLNGTWEKGEFEFDPRDREIIEGLSNLSFARRPDGSFLMVCRGGGMWVSRDGLAPYRQVTDGSVYPKVDGRFEDPVLWRDSLQYNMIVNDWYGRIAYYLRSADGFNWVVDPGEAYMPGIAVHPDGEKEHWFKYERLKIYQDEFGRSIQANFAVIDTLKFEDKPYDTHSSKNISIPLNPGLRIAILDGQVAPKQKYISLHIAAEEGFNPATDLDLASLRFGANDEVNFGRGAVAVEIEPDATGAVVKFDAKGSGITAGEFAPKLIGRKANGEMIYGYAALPGYDYSPAILSPLAPRVAADGKSCMVEVENFGLSSSSPAEVQVVAWADGAPGRVLASGKLAALAPYEAAQVQMPIKAPLPEQVAVIVKAGKRTLANFVTTPKP